MLISGVFAVNTAHWSALITTQETETTLQPNNCQFLPHSCFNICDIFFFTVRDSTKNSDINFEMRVQSHFYVSYSENICSESRKSNVAVIGNVNYDAN